MGGCLRSGESDYLGQNVQQLDYFWSEKGPDARGARPSRREQEIIISSCNKQKTHIYKTYGADIRHW